MSNTPPLRQKLKEVASDAILEAAERCMIRSGFEQTTIQQIATEAGCAAGTLYLYFKSKDEILRAICNRHARAIHERVCKAYENEKDPVIRFRVGTEVFLQYVNETKPFFRVFLDAMPLRHRHFHKMLDPDSLREHETMQNIEIAAIREAQAQGTMRNDIPAEILEEFSMSLCINMMEHLVNMDPPMSLEQQVDLIWKLTAGGMGIKQQA
jgi:AcrR family transcriptional regulator